MDEERKGQGMREAPAVFAAAGDQRHEVLAGLVERVTFHSLETGFCVLRVKARGHRDFVTTVGHAAMISAGEWVTASGEWINDHSHGLQFRARFLKTSTPSSIEGIEKYLGSGMIRGIGPVYAKKLVRDVAGRPIDRELGQKTAKRIAARRSSAEGKEGIAAFLEKRPPSWKA